MCRPKYLPFFVALLLVALIACTPAATPLPSIPAPSTPVSVTREIVRAVVATPTPGPTVQPKFKSLPLPKPVVEGMFDVGGRKLYVECYGDGSPSVILEHGLGTNTNTWYRIIPYLAAKTRVCAYDRANTGNSDVDMQARTMNDAADELQALLKAARIEGPYIVAGHSLGGFFALVYADRYPQDVTGITLIDILHPDQEVRWLAALPTPVPNESGTLKSIRDGLTHLPPQLEGIDWQAMLERMHAIKSLGSISLAVLVAADHTKNLWGNLPPELAANLDKAWLDLNKEYLNWSTDSSLILAQPSGHFIQIDQPQLVIDAILGLVDKARQK